MKKKNFPIVSAVAVVDLPDGHSVTLQAHEFICLLENKYTSLSAMKMREHDVEVSDKTNVSMILRTSLWINKRSL